MSLQDLIEAFCDAGSTITTNVSSLAAMPVLKKPTGFVFHESRCGSTLVANMLASDQNNLVMI